MAKGIIFSNREDFNSKQIEVFNYFKSLYPDNLATEYSDGIDALDESGEVLMIIDGRVLGFNFSPYVIVDVNNNDPKWFEQWEI
jgi:hypothetical protein